MSYTFDIVKKNGDWVKSTNTVSFTNYGSYWETYGFSQENIKGKTSEDVSLLATRVIHMLGKEDITPSFSKYVVSENRDVIWSSTNNNGDILPDSMRRKCCFLRIIMYYREIAENNPECTWEYE